MPQLAVHSAAEFIRLAQLEADALSGVDGLLIVALDGALEMAAELRLSRQPACVVAALGVPAGRANLLPNWVDVCAPDDAALDTLAAAVAAAPDAAATAVQLIRHNAHSSVSDGLFAESLAYSTLQHGATFQRWLAGREQRTVPGVGDPEVLVSRTANTLKLTLNRPERRNAYSSAMRDELAAALDLARVDPSVERVDLCGAGVAFCAGGDLDEFGSTRDAAAAHRVRMTRSVAALMHDLRARVRPRLHGACIGAGIELPAFAAHVVADESAFFQLPEVGFGLVPGAGGTVSVTRRIGRLRTNWLALTGERIGADVALEWGLVDAVQSA